MFEWWEKIFKKPKIKTKTIKQQIQEHIAFCKYQAKLGNFSFSQSFKGEVNEEIRAVLAKLGFEIEYKYLIHPREYSLYISWRKHLGKPPRKDSLAFKFWEIADAIDNKKDQKLDKLAESITRNYAND